MGHHGTGPVPARIMLVGEAWGVDEEKAGEPFVGTAGQELNRMLHEAGIMRSECYVTNLVNYRPPRSDIAEWIYPKKRKSRPTDAHIAMRDKWVLPIIDKGYQALLAEIQAVQPNVIVAFGNAALWALAGHWGVTKWRGSLLRHEESGAKLIPALHPAAILREWSQRAISIADLRRVKKHMNSREYNFPEYRFIISPSLDTSVTVLQGLLSRLDAGEELWLDFDLETRVGHIACAGLSWSRTEAICIPFMARNKPEGYWLLEEEAELVYLLYKVLTHKRALIRGQNLLYDCQYTYRHWHFLPNVKQDTMISQHSLFSDLPKSLAFQASMYAEHYVFWKEESKNI